LLQITQLSPLLVIERT